MREHLWTPESGCIERAGAKASALSDFGVTSARTMTTRELKPGCRWLLLLACLGACQTQRESSSQDAQFSVPVTVTPARAAEEKLTPALRRFVASDIDTETRRVLVDLSVQLDLDQFGKAPRLQELNRIQRRRVVIDALGQVAARSRAGLQPFLDKLRDRGSIAGYREFTVVNRILVTATAAGIEALAERADVAKIVEETAEPPPVLAGAALTPSPDLASVSWALTMIGADSAWRSGLDGSGVVVGLIDAGASAAHEQLKGSFRGGSSSWYDPTGEDSVPQDALTGHGTTILSVAVGGNVAGKTIGVAPRAAWIACVGIPEGRYNNVAFTECADWMLNTGQPDVLINAWVLPDSGCDRSLRRMVEVWIAAEILPVFAAGNHGPDPGTDRSPANYTKLYPGRGAAFSVGGVTAVDSVFARSSRGPNSCDGSFYPTIVAPANDVTAAFPLTPSTYIQTEGTSVAAGLVAGAAAILLQRYPDVAVTELSEALQAGAVDFGPAGPDNSYGFGRLYLPAALEALAETSR